MEGLDTSTPAPSSKQQQYEPIGAELSKVQTINVTSTSQHQIFDEKFDQEPENVRIKMADLAGRWNPKIKKRTREKEEQQEMIKKGSKTTVDMKIHTVQNTTNATRCYAIPLGEKAELF